MKLSVKEMWSEFKSFAFKGSLIDLAVAVVIGAAFGKVITSLVEDIIMPSVSYVVTAAHSAADVATDAAKKAGSAVGVTTTQATTQAATQAATQAVAPPEPPKPAPPPAPAPLAADKPPTEAVNMDLKIGRLNVGHFIGALINFVIVAFAVFIIVVKGMGSAMRKMSRPVAASEPTVKECPKCLSNIPIKATKCAHCTADL